MRRKWICLILCLLMILPIPVQAAGYRNVVDQAGILTPTENTELDRIAQEISAKYGMDVLIATVPDMNGAYADEYASYLNSSCGWWDTDDAVLFLLAMEERIWYIATFGEAMEAFSDRSLDILGEMAVSGFSEGYYEGFCTYLEGLEYYCDAYFSDTPVKNSAYDSPSRQNGLGKILPVSLLIGVIAATVVLLIMRAGMNTKRRQRSAAEYLCQGSFRLRTQRDIFLYSNVSKIRRQQNTGSSPSYRGGGSSAGRSHGGRGGRF